MNQSFAADIGVAKTKAIELDASPKAMTNDYLLSVGKHGRPAESIFPMPVDDEDEPPTLIEDSENDDSDDDEDNWTVRKKGLFSFLLIQ